ncbi:hypothetical protein V8C44DRAFT_352788 [Trichoderma aethiopicum]
MSTTEYYEYNRTITALRTHADRRRSTTNLQALTAPHLWKAAASRWGVDHLYACGVFCPTPGRSLTGLKPQIDAAKLKMDEVGWHQVMQGLLSGPGMPMSELGNMNELQIVRSFQNGSLGQVWSTLAPLLKRAEQTSDRQLRSHNAPRPSMRQPSATPSSSGQPSSTPSSGALPSSIGYVEADAAPLQEDMTVRFASTLIRCVLNYTQQPTAPLPVHYRDQRMEHKDTGLEWCAIDDGGVQAAGQSGMLQVAIVEAKRTFQAIRDGRPTVSDELLGQIVGEALALRKTNGSIFEDDVFVIVAIKHYFKFFHFSIPLQYLADLRSANPAGPLSTSLSVKSTDWFDATDRGGRQSIVNHILGLMFKADEARGM